MAFYRCTQCGQVFEAADGKTSCYCSNCGAHQLLAPTDNLPRQNPAEQQINRNSVEAQPPREKTTSQASAQQNGGQPVQPHAAAWRQGQPQKNPNSEYHPPIGKGAVPYPDTSQSIQPKIGMNKGLLFGLILGGIVLLLGTVVSIAVFAVRANQAPEAEEPSGGIYYDDDDIDYGSYKSYLFGEGYVSSGSEGAVSSSANGSDDEIVGSITVPEKHLVSAGGSHTVAIKDGKVLAVGDNDDGQCDVDGWSDIVTVSAGYEHTLGVRSDGTVVATGSNIFDQCEVVDWRNVTDVAAGTFHSLGLKNDGTVLAAGDNDDGQCDVGGWSDITEIAAGYHHSVGLKSDGTVVATGDNEYGQCNVSGWKDMVAIAVGDDHTVGLKKDGTVVATGDSSAEASEFAAMNNIVAISAGYSHTLALRKDGAVFAVGVGYDGRCDTGSWKDVTDIAAGGYYSVGLKSDGTFCAVGDNEKNQCDVKSWDIR